ncbi:MAG: MaoC/PaaZ C-terminal domain-containing protein, partial [Acetobacteraceae bacterium]
RRRTGQDRSAWQSPGRVGRDYPLQHVDARLRRGGAVADEDGFWFEDMHPGRVLQSAGGIRLDAEAISAFARQFDPHPAHLSEATAKTTMFGRQCASGWHTGSVTIRLITEILHVHGGGAGVGIERLRWLKPVYPGDELRVRIEIQATRPSRSRPGAGLVTYRCTTLNQHGETVQEFTTTILMPRRDAR